MPLAGTLTHPETGTREPTRSASDSPELPLDFSVQMANALFFKAHPAGANGESNGRFVSENEVEATFAQILEVVSETR